MRQDPGRGVLCGAMLLMATLAVRGAFADDAPAAATAAGGTAAKAPAATAAQVPDRLELDASAIRGNQELPKVLYIVPWKEPGLAQPAGRPLNSLVDEALAPVDREVFRRQMRYFGQLYAAPAPGSAGTGQAR